MFSRPDDSMHSMIVGRAGYGGTLDGMWPYSYNECDVGTLKNQSKDGGSRRTRFVAFDERPN